MSDWGKVPREVFMDARLTRQDIRVFGILCAYASGKTGVCTRRQEAIAEEIGASREGVNRSLKKLVSLGYVATKARAGMKRSLEYKVLIGEGTAGQMSLFDVQDAPRQAKPKRGKSDRKITSVVTPEVTSVVTSEVTAIEQTPVNRASPDGSAQLGEGEQAAEQPAVLGIHQRDDLDRLKHRLREAAGSAINEAHPSFIVLAEPIGWLVAGCDLEADVLPTITGLAARHRGPPIRSWKYFAEAVIEARDRRLRATSPPPTLSPSAVQAPPGTATIIPFDSRGTRHGPDHSADPPKPAGRFAAVAARRRRDLAGDGAGGADDPG
jgi:DNA-binding Lrp family transcriptional regulator